MINPALKLKDLPAFLGKQEESTKIRNNIVQHHRKAQNVCSVDRYTSNQGRLLHSVNMKMQETETERMEYQHVIDLRESSIN